MVYMGGLPGGELREVFGIWAEETDSLPEDKPGKAEYNGKIYKTQHICDIIHSEGAKVLGTYASDFYKGQPAVTVNSYGKGKAYCAAFRNDEDFVDDFCGDIIKEAGIVPDTGISAPRDVLIRKRGTYVFVFNFTDSEKNITLDKAYYDVLSEKEVSGELSLPLCGYYVLEDK